MARARTILETERLLLRELDGEDAAVFFRLATDPAVTRFIPVPPPPDEAAAREVIRARRREDYEGRGYGRWACVLKETGDVVGWSGPRYLAEIGEAELGYRFLPEHWGRGLATEAGTAVVRHWFGPMGGTRLVALIDPLNTASANVARKLGFRIEGKVTITGTTVDRWARSVAQAF